MKAWKNALSIAAPIVKDNFQLDFTRTEAGANFEAATVRTSRRLRLARVMVAGAKDKTSQRIAERVVGEWFAPVGAEAMRKLAA
jgi:hypothetical protein